MEELVATLRPRATSSDAVPLYEVYLVGDGKPEVKLTPKAVKVGDVVEFGNRAWRVRTEDRGANGFAGRFIGVRERTRGSRSGPAQSSRGNGAALGTSDKLGVLREAAARVARQRAKRAPAQSPQTQPPA